MSRTPSNVPPPVATYVTLTSEQFQQLLATASTNSSDRSTSSVNLSDPEPFSGGHDKLSTFLFQCRLKFHASPTKFADDTIKIAYAVSFLRGPALLWAEPKSKDGQMKYQVWSDFEDAFKSAFGDPDPTQTARAKLTRLSQKGSASTYWSEFQTLAARAEWDDSYLMYKFVSGLKDTLREKHAYMDEQPKTLTKLVEWAIRIDNQIFAYQRSKKESQKPWIAPSASPSDNSGTTPMELDVTKFSKLTIEERRRRRQQGLCMYCGAKGHYASRCPAKKPSTTFRLAETKGDEWQEVKDDPQQ